MGREAALFPTQPLYEIQAISQYAHTPHAWSAGRQKQVWWRLTGRHSYTCSCSVYIETQVTTITQTCGDDICSAFSYSHRPTAVTELLTCHYRSFHTSILSHRQPSPAQRNGNGPSLGHKSLFFLMVSSTCVLFSKYCTQNY